MTPLTAVVAPSAADLYPCDQFRFADLLTDVERTVLARLRAVLDAKVRPRSWAATGLSAFTR